MSVLSLQALRPRARGLHAAIPHSYCSSLTECCQEPD
jgi:hypothetical protein